MKQAHDRRRLDHVAAEKREEREKADLVALVSNTEDELSALRAENDKLRRRGESQSRSTPTRYLVDMERITREKEHLELAVRMRDMCRIFCLYTAPHHTVLYPQLNYF